MDRDDPGYRGQSDYNAAFLAIYDPLVLGLFARFVWRCPSTELVAGYRQHIRDPHLDVGPGTGYFLRAAGLSLGSRVTLLDPNPNVLRHASRRLRHLDVTSIEADVLKPLPVDGPFESAALHGVLHCLPGPSSRKAAAVANIASVLSPTGVLFGASVLGRTGTHSWLARRFLAVLNRRGTFDNLEDSEESLRLMLEASFEQVELETVGSFALFTARGPRTGRSPDLTGDR